ncbi:GAMM1 protein [Fomitopsis betulina]|nr:GAMM1 protein [Fomitopsis betulina]
MEWSLLPPLRLYFRPNIASLPASLRRAPHCPIFKPSRTNTTTQGLNRSPDKLRHMSSSLEGALEHPAKKQKMEETRKVIGTHNGTFHCDEALAVYLLKRTKAYGNADLKRSRDPAVLDTCSIVVDVGGVYDEKKQRFDHHQRGFQEVFGHGYNTKLSSAGLVYKHFGKEIIASRVHATPEEEKVQTLWLKVYKEYIEAIDAIDNGVNQYATEEQPKYRIRTDISSRVGFLNSAWNEPFDSNTVDARFLQASSLVGEEFISRLDYYANAWLPARNLVSAAIQQARQADVSSGGKIIVFYQFLPWKEHLSDLEEELKIPEESKPIYVLYPDETANNWRIQAVPVRPESFDSRKALPEVWRGLRDDVLSLKSGVDGCIFVHASGFIGGNKTKEGALQLAKLALEM